MPPPDAKGLTPPPPELVGGGATAATVLGSRPGAPLYVWPYFCCSVTSELDEWNPSGRYLDCFGRTAADENPDRAYPEDDDAADDGAAAAAAAAAGVVAAEEEALLVGAAGIGVVAVAAASDTAAFTGVGGWGVANNGAAPIPVPVAAPGARGAPVAILLNGAAAGGEKG